MKIRLADYIVNKLDEAGITTTFTVVGGGAMNLNDAFGHNDKMQVIYNHHEQACAIAAEGYARVNNECAAVCVTTGPGGTNALKVLLVLMLILFQWLLFLVKLDGIPFH